MLSSEIRRIDKYRQRNSFQIVNIVDLPNPSLCCGKGEKMILSIYAKLFHIRYLCNAQYVNFSDNRSISAGIDGEK